MESFNNMLPVVASIVVTYNPEMCSFERALSAHAATRADLLIIIDNNSNNANEIEKVVKEVLHSRATFLSQTENCGIAAAQNIGITCARETDCTHVVLFDQDSQPSPDIIKNLLEDESQLIATGVRVGAIGPSFRDPRTGSYAPMMRIVGPMIKKVRHKCGTEPVEVSFIIASGSLIRIDVLNRVGTMNEDFFIDVVDIEWCLRARSQGFKIFVSTKAVMTHMIGDTREYSLGREISIHAPLRRYYMARNWILLARLPWVPVGIKIREVFLVFTRVPIFLYSINFKREYVKYVSKGILHGFLGRSGQYK
jgi:rhamnosyltransferase